MLVLSYKLVFLFFTIYYSIYSISYGIYEIKEQKNKYGGIAVITCTLFSIVFGNIIFWIK